MTPKPFVLHPDLARTTHPVLEWSGLHLRLNRNAAVTWFIIVPETVVEDFFDLSFETQAKIAQLTRALHGFLRCELGLSKVNIAVIGNVVAQLHIHVVGRRAGDACWPKPVWGHLEATELEWGERLEPLKQALTAALVKQGLPIED